jgi:cell volume regulation protein A
MLESMNIAVLIGSLLIAVAVFTSLISFRFGAPLLLVFLAIGLLAGEDGIGGIEFDNGRAAFFIGSVALAVILFDSGFETRMATLRQAGIPAALLATVGVAVTAAVFGLMAQVVFGLQWLQGLLLGSIVAPTDAAAVFFLLRVGGINLRERVRSTLEVESALNDPLSILLTLTIVSVLATDMAPASFTLGIASEFLLEAAVGAIVGAVGGLGIVQIINRARFEAALYPILLISMVLAVWALAGLLHGSGFLAVYVAGVVAGNARMRHTAALRRFQQGVTWLGQIAMFLTLGLLATPSQFPAVALGAVLLALFLTFIARPLAVWLCLLPFRYARNEVAFVSWVGLRGAVSIMLAIVPVVAELPSAQIVFNTAFIVVLVSLVLQGWTIRPMANFLGIVVPARQGVVDRIELELPGRGDYEIVAYVVHPDSPVARGERVPRWARPSLLIRDGRSLRPHLAGRPQAGDQIYVITTPEYVTLLDRLFARAAARTADPELFGEFVLAPDTKLKNLASAYGVTARPEEAEMTVAELLRRDLAGDLEQGDRVSYGPVDIIVRHVSEDHEVEEVGLALEHRDPPRPRLPVFHSWSELRQIARRWWRGKRSPPAAGPPAPEGVPQVVVAMTSGPEKERPAPADEPPADNPDNPPATAA